MAFIDFTPLGWTVTDDGHELAETCLLILTRIYILHTN